MPHGPTKSHSKSFLERIRALHPSRRSGNDPESGQALVEFALILPLLLVFLLLILDFGRAINYWVDSTHLASEGARLAAVDKFCPDEADDCPDSLQEYIKGRADSEELKTGGPTGIVSPGLEVCVEYPEGRAEGNPVLVTVSAEYDWIPFIGNQFGLTQTTIRGEATHRLERDEDVVEEGCEE